MLGEFIKKRKRHFLLSGPSAELVNSCKKASVLKLPLKMSALKRIPQ